MLVYDRLQQAIATAKRNTMQVGLLFLDLDEFKPVNDTLGHEAGDLLLKEAARRIKDCVRESDTVGRIGGDEFVAILPDIATVQDATLAADKIRNVLSQPFHLANWTLSISSSIGIAIYPDHGNDEAMLLRNADAAMYHAKESGGNKVSIFRSQVRELCT
jgi:diguanylate cyclase (GGDEF)-like protein